ncbi:hypothetical protein GE061_010863 [Apolygus lucorum]|uniref:Uncharacterized protein n=1 Tax=Apolygus lucorum TaxID=248454 RepID=A0A6A4JRI3_APOLU|nr:hypothetical protein GE061_010863 [Apolygus lucorum]
MPLIYGDTVNCCPPGGKEGKKKFQGKAFIPDDHIQLIAKTYNGANLNLEFEISDEDKPKNAAVVENNPLKKSAVIAVTHVLQLSKNVAVVSMNSGNKMVAKNRFVLNFLGHVAIIPQNELAVVKKKLIRAVAKSKMIVAVNSG